METTTLQKINNLIKDLPDYLAEELLEYVEYLVYKFHKDEELSDEQKRVILRGLEDIKYGRTHIETTDTEGIVIQGLISNRIEINRQESFRKSSEAFLLVRSANV